MDTFAVHEGDREALRVYNKKYDKWLEVLNWDGVGLEVFYPPLNKRVTFTDLSDFDFDATYDSVETAREESKAREIADLAVRRENNKIVQIVYEGVKYDVKVSDKKIFDAGEGFPVYGYKGVEMVSAEAYERAAYWEAVEEIRQIEAGWRVQAAKEFEENRSVSQLSVDLRRSCSIDLVEAQEPWEITDEFYRGVSMAAGRYNER